MVRQLREEAAAVVVALKNLRAAVAAAGEMIDGVRKIDSCWARHDQKSPSPASFRNP